MTLHAKRKSVRSRGRKHGALSKHRNRKSNRRSYVHAARRTCGRSKVGKRRSRQISRRRRLRGGVSDKVKHVGAGVALSTAVDAALAYGVYKKYAERTPDEIKLSYYDKMLSNRKKELSEHGKPVTEDMLRDDPKYQELSTIRNKLVK